MNFQKKPVRFLVLAHLQLHGNETIHKFQFSKFSIAALLMFVARCRFCKNLCFFSNKHAIRATNCAKRNGTAQKFYAFRPHRTINVYCRRFMWIENSMNARFRCQCLVFAVIKITNQSQLNFVSIHDGWFTTDAARISFGWVLIE